MAQAWYEHEELIDQAEGAKIQPEFDPEVEEDPEDTSWEKKQALIDRLDEIDTIVDGFTQPYPTVSADAPLPS